MRTSLRNLSILVVLFGVISSAFSDDVTVDAQKEESELNNQSDVYLKEMEEIFKNESKVLFREHIENFRLEMENEVHDIEKFIMNEYDTIINTLNKSGDTTRDLDTESKSSILDKLLHAREHAKRTYKQFRDQLHSVVDDIESKIDQHQMGQRALDYVKRAFHKIAILVKLSKKDPASGETPDDEEAKYQQQILQQMPIANYFPQLSNAGQVGL